MSTKVWLLAVLGLAPLAGGLSACRASQQASEGGERNGGAAQSKAATAVSAAKKAAAPGSAVYLHRWAEPKEGALTILVPEGWTAEGGVVRVDPRLGPANSVGAKIEIAVKRDRAGSVTVHWLPNYTYKDPRFLMGAFPVGSNYMGAMVYPLMDPQSFLAEFVLRRERPQAQNVQIVERETLPELAQRYQQRAAAANMRFEAGGLAVTYDEGGVHYREELTAAIENVTGAGMGMWTNHETVAVRAPAAEFAQVEPLIGVIVSSVKGNPQWVAGENRGAAVRAHNALETQRYLQEERRQIVEHQRQTNAEARHSGWLFLTGQDDYVNPHTGEVEQGSNQYKHRWVNSAGDVIYTNDGDYDPSWDSRLPGRSDYKVSPRRQR